MTPTATTTKKKKTETAKPKKTVQPAKKTVAKRVKTEAKPSKKEAKISYFEGTGRRKTAVARVRIFTQGTKDIVINGKDLKEYFPLSDKQKTVLGPFETMGSEDKFGVSAQVKGGGITAQAEAIRHGISRALVKLNPDFRKRLKKAGFLTRDPRMRERKKFGLKRARRAPQWSKR